MQRRAFLGLTLAGMIPTLSAQTRQTKKTGLLIDRRFADHFISPHHPESPARFYAIEQALKKQTTLYEQVQLISITDKLKSEPWLNTIHSDEHINSLKRHDNLAYQRALLATSGVLEIIDQVMAGQLMNAFCASRPPGHHAKNEGREEGFCYFNHVAIAARYIQRAYGLKKILIVDWDYHHGNSTEWAFYQDPSVLFFSTHDQFAYPGTGSPTKKGAGEGTGYNINVHLDCDTDDQTIVSAFEQKLLPVVKQFKPDFILISAGFDSRQDDLLGCFKVSDQGFVSLTKMMMELANTYCRGRLVSILEGGYNLQGNASAALAHLRTLTNQE